jgi:hypothetical protein
VHHTEPVLQCSFWYLGNADMALTDPWSGEDDDTGYDYDDMPSGNFWRPGAEPGQASGDGPGRLSFLP